MIMDAHQMIVNEVCPQEDFLPKVSSKVRHNRVIQTNAGDLQDLDMDHLHVKIRIQSLVLVTKEDMEHLTLSPPLEKTLPHPKEA